MLSLWSVRTVCVWITAVSYTHLEIRKYLVFAGMFLLFLGAMWLIFAPSEQDKRKAEKNAGFNTELPDPRGAGIEEDKIAARCV